MLRRHSFLLGFSLLAAVLVAGPVAGQGMSYGKAPRIKRDPELEGQAKVDTSKLGGAIDLDQVFYDHDGKEMTLRQAVDNKPTLLVLAYSSCPKLCNELLNDLVKELRALARLGLVAGKDFQVVRVSIDPKESPPFSRKMRESYLAELDKRSPSEPGFWFLTAGHGQGSDVMAGRDKIKKLSAEIGFDYVADNQKDIDAAGGDRVKEERAVRKTKDFVHASVITVLTPAGTISTYLQGLRRPAELPEENGWTAEDIRQALLTANEGKLGTVVARLAMLCFSYDSESGHYRPVMTALGLVAAPFPILIGLIVWTAWRRSKREPKLTPATAPLVAAEPVTN